MEPIAIRFILTARYVLGMNWAASIRVIVVAWTLGALVLVFGLTKGDPGSIFSGIAIPAVITFGLPLFALLQARTWIGEPLEVAFTEEGIRQDAFGRHFHGEWSSLKSMNRRLGYLLITLRGGGTFGVPVSAFGSPAEVEALLATARERIAAYKKVAPTRA